MNSTDYLIAGSSLCAVSAAYTLAKANNRVTLVTKETFLGYEPGMYGQAFLPESSLADPLVKTFFPDKILQPSLLLGGYVPIHPDRMKIHLEDLLMEKGVRIIYGAALMSVCQKGSDYIAAVVSKGGKVERKSLSTIDFESAETDMGYKDEIVCKGFMTDPHQSAPDAPSDEMRIVHFTGIEGGVKRLREEINRLGLNDSFKVYPGYCGEGHGLIGVVMNISEVKVEKVHSNPLNLRPNAHHAKYAHQAAYAHQVEHKAEMVYKNVAHKQYLTMKITLDQIEALQNALPWLRSASLGRIALKAGDVHINFLEELHRGETCAMTLPDHSDLKEICPDITRITCDLVIAGGGTSGVPAAYFAQDDLHVVLLDMNPILGGTSTIGGVSSYWFGNREEACAQVDNRTQLLHQRLGVSYPGMWWSRHDCWHNELKSFVLHDMCMEKGIALFLETIVFDAEAVDGKITMLRCFNNGKIIEILLQGVIDATGDGDIAYFAGADYTYGSEKGGVTFWASLGQFTSPTDHQNNFTSNVRIDDIYDYTQFIMVNRRRGETYDHCAYVAPRESRHIKGRVTLTLKDQLLQRRYDDTVHSCFSNYDPKGKSTSDIIYVGLLPPNLNINLPYRCLVPESLNNILIAGKAFSCEHDAFPAVRMQPDLMEVGRACGLLASYCITNEIVFDRITPEEIRAVLGRSKQEDVPQVDLEILADSMTGEEQWDWIDMEVDEAVDDIPMVAAFMFGEREQAIAALSRVMKESEGNRCLLAAKLLLWHHDESGFDILLHHVEACIRESTLLPKRKGSIRFCQLLPDHGVMAEVIYNLNLLTFAQSDYNRKRIVPIFREILHRLRDMDRNYYDIRESIYHYVEAFAYAANQTGMKEYVPMLEAITSFAEFSFITTGRKTNTSHIMAERFLILYKETAEALYHIDREKGLAALAKMNVLLAGKG